MELHFEGELVQCSVVSAGAWEHADAIDGVIAGDVAVGDVFKERDELGVDVGGEAKTLEVGGENSGVGVAKWVEVLRAGLAVSLVNSTESKVRNTI